ncbi:MAG: hypothetical protein M3Z03_09160, partial [Actinomycetota bacterium]|nr:hypothetical protein [Actinomycetota bacterium]
ALASAATEAWGADWLARSGVVVMGAGGMLTSTDTSTNATPTDTAPTTAGNGEAPPHADPSPSPPPEQRASSPNRTRLVAALVVLALLIVGAVVLLTGGGDDDGGDATTTTTTTAEGDGGGVAVPDTTLAGALALSVDDLPAGFEQRALGGVIDAAATDDPCLATLPAPYVFQAQGDAFGNDEPGLEVSSTVALTADADAGSANAEAFGGDGFLDCVRQAVQASVGEGPVTATLDRTALTGLATYAGSWVIEARSDAGAAFVESVVLARGRAVVTVNFSSADGRVSEAFRDDVLSSVDARLRGTDQETGG